MSINFSLSVFTGQRYRLNRNTHRTRGTIEMVANFKKKLYLAVIYVAFVSGIRNAVIAEDVSNDTVVMKIVNKNSTHEIKPMAMINQHVFERKGKTLVKYKKNISETGRYMNILE